MQPLFFAGPSGPLYGCYHAPKAPARDMGVVLAGAHGHEYIRFHRVLRQLARMLAEAGFPVLRFDYSGCGDSAGGPEVWSLERWGEDLELACEEQRLRSGLARVAVVGLRLGGTLACRVAGGRASPCLLVLWDPVVRGTTYLQELRAAHRSMLSYAHVTPAKDAVAGEEVLGFALPAALSEELAALELGGLERAPAPPVLLVESTGNGAQAALHEALARGGEVELRRFANPHLWAWDENWARVHVPIQILQAIVERVRTNASRRPSELPRERPGC